MVCCPLCAKAKKHKIPSILFGAGPNRLGKQNPRLIALFDLCLRETERERKRYRGREKEKENYKNIFVGVI